MKFFGIKAMNNSLIIWAGLIIGFVLVLLGLELPNLYAFVFGFPFTILSIFYWFYLEIEGKFKKSQKTLTVKLIRLLLYGWMAFSFFGILWILFFETLLKD